MPARIDLAQLALRTLEDALAQLDAANGPIVRNWGQRLALAWLAHECIAERWQCIKFWKELADPKDWAHTPDVAQYIRTTSLHGLLDCWHLRAGWAPPGLMQRARWASAYAPELDSDAVEAMLDAMCNLYRLKTPTAAIADLFRAVADDGLNAASEVYPGYNGLVIAGGRVRAMTWGFPVVLKGKNGQPLKPKPVNNARFDKLGGYWRRWATDPANRCLIPFNAYAEAVGPRGRMTRTWLSVADRPIAAWAGL